MDRIKVPISNHTLNIIKNTHTDPIPVTATTSLSTLVIWNISKALDQYPTLNIKEAIPSAQRRLEEVSNISDIQTIFTERPYERHLACALLAWQQLGHSDADSLCRFIESMKNEEDIPTKLSSHSEFLDVESQTRSPRESMVCGSQTRSPKEFTICGSQTRSSMESKICEQQTRSSEECNICESLTGYPREPKICSNTFSGFGAMSNNMTETRYKAAMDFSRVNSYEMGPVVRLPVETKLVMRVENTSHGNRRPGGQENKPSAPEKDIITKIDQACCLDSACSEKLAAMDATTEELRQRAGQLARREAERVELLERAEAAWKDLEQGYQRRLTLAEEKEEDIAKQITKLLEERIAYKSACSILTQELKDKSIKTEKERVQLGNIEQIVCELACQRLKLSEESARGDSVVAEQATRAAQLDRDLLFKEEEVRRNMTNLQGEVQSARMLTCEAERATRAELAALRDQMAEVSNKLLSEDDHHEKTKAELDELRKEKMEIIEDLEGCKAQCDGHMQGRLDELTKKRETLSQLREKVMECRCKIPVDEAVEVKRTPSLAALCKCTPEDKILESCSCTSMRSQLLSNLFADLFSGLQSELSGAVTLMPCQLLKCLEDKHNWDRSSVVKSNLTNYFSRLLGEELDIAIVTSVENYHAKWVGISCADAIKMTPGPADNTENEGWQERAIERRAQKLASKLAEQLFEERAEELEKRARDIVEAGPPPCECDTKAKMPEGCSCEPTKPSSASPVPQAQADITPVYWHQSVPRVSQPTLQTEDHKKAGGSPERDTHEIVMVKSPKKSHGKGRGHGKKNDGALKNAGANEFNAFLNPVKNSPGGEAAPWQLAMQDVTQLRQQIDDIRKETIKKEDLRVLEDKITKIIHRATINAASANSKKNPHDSIINETMKRVKINRAVSNPAYCDMDNATNRRILDNPSNETKQKSILNRKLYKKNNPTYAVNMCLCSTKRQHQKEPNERNAFEAHKVKQKNSNDNMSQMSSTLRQSKPINNNSFLSEAVSARTYMSKESDEQYCRSNCVCFHKIPSNTSIDNLLETLAKWKGDLDASFALKSNSNRKTSCYNFSTNNIKYLLSHDGNASRKSKTSVDTREKSPEGSDHKVSLYKPNAKCFGKCSAKATEPMVSTDSVYMGAVNLDNSNEDLCKCGNSMKKVKKTPFKCIASSKCSCERILEARKMEAQISHGKKEKHKDISVIKTRQEQRLKEIIVVDNTSTIKDKNIIIQNKEINSKGDEFTDEITKARDIRTSDYQIKFLGVTLVDVNPPAKKKVSHGSDIYNCSNKNTITTNVVDCILDDRKTNKKIENNQQGYLVKNSHPVPEFAQFSYIKKNNRIIPKDDPTDSNNEISSCDTASKQENKHAIISLSHEKKNAGNDHLQKKYTLAYKTTSDQNVTMNVCDNDQFQRCYDKKNPNVDSRNTNITNKTLISASKISSQVNSIRIDQHKVNNQDNGLLQDNNFKNNSYLSSKILKGTSEPRLLPRECSRELEELKNFINTNFVALANNEDAAIDVQSVNFFKNIDESCICCNKLNDDNCRDLEDNTFHLLEEYLKKKLNDFKTKSCSSMCIPREEEEKIFGIILQRVKQLISESTNQVACKCSSEGFKSQGSWNRAYGLLQEYLKTKIKKIQCSCLLAEDNKDTILPDVLDKISNLIEHDFQRLKKLCSCKSASNTLENKNAKQIDLEEKVIDPNILLLAFKKNLSIFSQTNDQIDTSSNQITPKNLVMQCMTPPLPGTSLMKEVTFDNSLPEHVSNHSLNTSKNCNTSSLNSNNALKKGSKVFYLDVADEDKNKVEFSKVQNVSENTVNFGFIGKLYDSNAKIKCETSIQLVGDGEKTISINKFTEQQHMTENQIPSEHTNDPKESISQPSVSLNTLLLNNIQKDLKSLPSTCNTNNSQKSTDRMRISSKENNEATDPNQSEKFNCKPCEVPYIGYTINCTCDTSLGDHICPKNLSNTDPNVINEIIKNSVPDEKFYEEISYIMHGQPLESINQNASLEDKSKIITLSGDPEKDTATNIIPVSQASCSCKISKKLVLKQSPMNNVKKSHANTNTNTFDDNASTVTDCSDASEWCDCVSQANHKLVESDRLKRSLYFPAPIEDFDEHIKHGRLNNKCRHFTANSLPKHVCNCEMVPICHVKMLVENIESKLATANCTCDSLIPKVCPVHSSMC